MGKHEDAPLFERCVNATMRATRGHGGLLFTALGAVTLSLTFASGWWAIPGGILAILGVVTHMRMKPSYSDLKDDLAAAERAEAESAVALQVALDSMLTRIATECGINEVHQRVTVYCHAAGKFVPLARFSSNTRLSARSRSAYPSNQGVIGLAWESGSYTARDWPEDLDEWRDAQEITGIPRDVARGFNMRPRSMVGKRLTHDGTHIGVIIMESEQPRGVSGAILGTTNNSLLIESLCEILVSAAPRFAAVAASTRLATQ